MLGVRKKIYHVIWLLLAILSFSGGSFAALVYTPTPFDKSKAKIVVVVHGCLQSAESMALGTGWDQLADAGNFVVIYPQVSKGSNPVDCWGWYLQDNQKRETGQLAEIMREVQSAKKALDLKDPDVFAVGISSGAATVAGLLACFPKDFKAGALHSGPSYGLAKTLHEGEQVLKHGPSPEISTAPCRPRDFIGDVMAIQGTSDPVVNPKNADRVLFDFLGVTEPSSVKEAKDGGLEFTVSEFRSDKGGRGRLILIKGLGHAWSGFTQNLRHAAILGPQSKIPTQIPFFSDKGPSATNLMWEFFKETPARADSRSPSGSTRRK